MPASPPCRLEKTRWKGFDAYALDNGLVSAIVVPALGGKIASLKDLRRGREWLWSNPALAPASPEFGGDYVARFDSGGFDECFPSVAPTRYPTSPWEGTSIPDHGEVWGMGWQHETFCDGDLLEVRTWTSGVRFPYRFERTLLMGRGESGVRLGYRVTNPTPFPFPFLWSSHPLLAVRPGMRLVVPLRELTVYSSVDDRFGQLGSPQEWPLVWDYAGKEWDLSTLPGPEAAIAVKLFSRAPAAGFVAVQDPERGGELRIQFDPEEVTHLGMWLNFGGWSGVSGAEPYYNLALEPGIGASDDLALAVKHYREHGLVLPMGKRSWQLELVLK